MVGEVDFLRLGFLPKPLVFDVGIIFYTRMKFWSFLSF